MAKPIEKYRSAFDTATKQFVAGKISEADFRKALKKLQDANKKELGTNLDFVDVEHYLDKRKKAFSAYVRNSAVDNMSKSTWKSIKKEAGIKGSGFLKKSDASVGKHIEKYGKLHDQWKNTAVKTAGGDRVLLSKTIDAGEDLKKALASFIAAKEFKSDLAKDLQTQCQKFIGDLTDEIARLKDLQGEAHDPTAMLLQLNRLGLGQFKV